MAKSTNKKGKLHFVKLESYKIILLLYEMQH